MAPSKAEKAFAEVEALLCRDGAAPELLAEKLDALGPDKRAALFDKEKNVGAVKSRLSEEVRKGGEMSLELVRQLARTVPDGSDVTEETKQLIVTSGLIPALADALDAALNYALTDGDELSDEDKAYETIDSLVAAVTALVEMKGKVRDLLGEKFPQSLTVITMEGLLPAMLRRDASQNLLDLVTCSKDAAATVRAIVKSVQPGLGQMYLNSLSSAGDMITQVNIAETLYRLNKEAFFTNLGPDREAPAIDKVLGVDAFGPVKRDFYALLCMRRAPKKEALYNELRSLVTRMNRALPGPERKVHTFLPEAVVVLPTRVERPAVGGGWELLEDVYSKRVDFNQTGFTLHQLEEPDADGNTVGGSQPPGSQGPPSAAVEPSHAVDVEYSNIRCIKRDTASTPQYCIWTIGLNEPVDDDDDDDGRKLSNAAKTARAAALKAMTTSDAAITLKFKQSDAAALEACVVPLIFEWNPDVAAEQPVPAAVKMSHATLVQGKSAMDSQPAHGGGGGGSLLDDATVAGALNAAAPSENFGGPPSQRPMRIVQPPAGTALRDVFGGDKGAADSQALAPLGTQPGPLVVPSGGGGDSQFYIGTQLPPKPAAGDAAAHEAGLHQFVDQLLSAGDADDMVAEAAREAAAEAARRKKKAPPPPAADSDSEETKGEPAAAATQAPRRPSAAAAPQQQAWGQPVQLDAAAAAAPPPPPSAKKGAAAAAAKAGGAKKKSVTIKKPTQDPTPVPPPPPPESELTDPPATGAAAEAPEPSDPFAFVPAKAPAAAAKGGKGAAKGGGDKRAAQATPKRAPKKAPLGLTASLGSGGKHAVPSRAAAKSPPAPAPAPAPEPEAAWDAPPPPGFLGAQPPAGGAMEVDDDGAALAPLDEEDEEAPPAPPPRKSALAAKAMPPAPPRAPAGGAAGGRKSVAAPKTAEPEELAAAVAAGKRKAAEEAAATAAAEREAEAEAAKKAADAEKAATAKKAAAAAKKAAAAEKAAAEKAAAAEAARKKKATAAAEKAKPKAAARKAASASEGSSGGGGSDDGSDGDDEEAAPAPKPRGARDKAAAAGGAARDDTTPAERAAEVSLRRAAEALAAPQAAAEAAEAAKQPRRVSKPLRSPPPAAAPAARRTSAELMQGLLVGICDDAPVAQSSGLTACEPVEPRALFRSASARPPKRKAGGSPSDAAAGGDDAPGRAAKRTRPLPGDADDATLSLLQRIVADAKAQAAARAKEEIAAMLSAAWQELDAALTALAQRHADERDALAAEFQASRAATLRRLNASREELQTATKRFKADVTPLMAGRGVATEALEALITAVEERQTEARQKHAAELKSVTKKMITKLKALEEDVTRMQTVNTDAQVKNTLKQLLCRM